MKPGLHNKIELTPGEIFAVNVFTIVDIVDAAGLRRFINPRPSAFESYFRAFGARGFRGRLAAIWAGKIDKTRRLIALQRQRGEIPERVAQQCRKTPCGWMRLIVARRHDRLRNRDRSIFHRHPSAASFIRNRKIDQSPLTRR